MKLNSKMISPNDYINNKKSKKTIQDYLNDIPDMLIAFFQAFLILNKLFGLNLIWNLSWTAVFIPSWIELLFAIVWPVKFEESK